MSKKLYTRLIKNSPFLLFILLFLNSQTLQGQCTDWLAPSPTTGWVDFNNTFGGAPCDDGNGCPFNEITAFEIFAAEAYAMNDIIEGATYTFSACNGTGGTAWTIDYTIISPSGTVDASGLDAGSACAITWTASESGNYLIVINEEGQCGGGPNTATNNGFPAITCVSGAVCNIVDDCVAGTLLPPENIIVCPGETASLNADTTVLIPTGGAYNWIFTAGPDGGGGVTPSFTLTNSTSSFTFDDDLNGVLSANSLQPLTGTWNIQGMVATDGGNAVATACDTTDNQVTVQFGAADDLICICRPGDLLTVDSVDVCPGTTTTVSIDSIISIPDGGGFGWLFEAGPDGMGGSDTLIVVPDTLNSFTFDSDLNGLLSGGGFMPLSGTWHVQSVVFSDPMDPEGTVCGTSANQLVVTFLPDGDPSCPCVAWQAPSPTTGWVDFNNQFGGAPCDDGSGCAFNEIIVFEIFAAEAYLMDNIIEGGTYTFSACNGAGGDGTGGQAWDIEYTILTPSGAVDAFGLDEGSNCAITWTASEEGTYLIVINEAGQCGGGPNTATNNGFPAITCVDAPCPSDCLAGVLTTIDSLVVCVGDSVTVATDGSEIIPEGGGFGWLFTAGADGGGAETPSFVLPNSTSPFTFDEDLNGILSSNGLTPFSGTWQVQSIVYTDPNDPSNTACDTSDAQLVFQFLPADDPACTVCLAWQNPSSTTGWTDFNNQFGGAPCDDGSGCPFNEITAFEIFAAEAYAMDNIIQGGTYTFSACNGAGGDGTGGQAWDIDYTIIAPSGAVDASGLDAGSNCAITWTASEGGTYLIVINEAGECGGGSNTGTNNGFPAITCVSDAPCSLDCSMSDLAVAGTPEDISCNGETDGSIFLTLSGGIPPYSVEWSTGDTTQSITGLAAGVYSYTVMDSISCAVIDSFTIVEPDPITADAVVVDESGAGNADGSIELTPAGGTPPYSFLWSTGDDTQNISGLSGGQYTVTITDDNGCSDIFMFGVVTDVNDIQSLEIFRLRPNPSNGPVFLSLQFAEAEDIRIEVLNTFGQLIFQQRFDKISNLEHPLDLEQYASGLYIVRVITKDSFATRELLLTR